MEKHVARARELFLTGYNCAQAVFAAFPDVTGMEESAALKLSSPLGGGVGRLREVCGAVSAMTLVLGAKKGNDAPDAAAKAAVYEQTQALVHEFQAQNGSYLCRELLNIVPNGSPAPDERTAEYYKARPCLRLVESAAALVAKTLGVEEEE